MKKDEKNKRILARAVAIELTAEQLKEAFGGAVDGAPTSTSCGCDCSCDCDC